MKPRDTSAPMNLILIQMTQVISGVVRKALAQERNMSMNHLNLMINNLNNIHKASILAYLEGQQTSNVLAK